MIAEGREGFFTLGIHPQDFDLPHPRIELPVILVIRRVLLRAFELLREKGFPFATAKEDEITVGLEGVIENDLRQKNGARAKGGVAGFTRRLFDAVTRHHSVANYSGEKLKKEPDLCFKLRADEEPRVLATQLALFIECKPVDASHAAGSAYVDDGLQRFVDGDYAWAMQDAMMLGYARHGRAIETHLVPAMREPRRRARSMTIALPTRVDCQGAAATSSSEALYRSTHRRKFNWPGEKGPATGITIYHEWHDASGAATVSPPAPDDSHR